MLEGDVEVAADLRAGHRLEQAVRDLLGIAVEEAQPGDAGDTREPLQEPGEPVPDPPVAAEPGRVVGDEVDLPDAESRERPDLAQDRGRAPRDVRAFDQGDGAETAAVGTPLRDLDVGPGAGRRDQPGRSVRIEEGPARLPKSEALDDRDDPVEAPDPGPGVDPGEFPLQPGPVPFHVTAGGDDPLPRVLAFQPEDLGQGRFGLLAGRSDETAGVDDDRVGLLGPAGEGIAGRFERAEHDLAVDEVLGAAEADEGDRSSGAPDAPGAARRPGQG